MSLDQDHLYRPCERHNGPNTGILSLTKKAPDDKSNGPAVNSIPRLPALDTLEYDIPGVT